MGKILRGESEANVSDSFLKDVSNRDQKWNVGPEHRKERETFRGCFGKRTPFLRLRTQLKQDTRANVQGRIIGLIWRKGLGMSRADISGNGRRACEPEFNYRMREKALIGDDGSQVGRKRSRRPCENILLRSLSFAQFIRLFWITSDEKKVNKPLRLSQSTILWIHPQKLTYMWIHTFVIFTIHILFLSSLHD